MSTLQEKNEIERELHRQKTEALELQNRMERGVFRNDSALQRAGVGEESGMSASELADKLSRDDSVRAAYLADRGETLEPVMQAKEFNRYGNDALAKLVQKIGVQELARVEADILI